MTHIQAQVPQDRDKQLSVHFYGVSVKDTLSATVSIHLTAATCQRTCRQNSNVTVLQDILNQYQKLN